MPKTQTVVLHITVGDDAKEPQDWDWSEELDLVMLKQDGNEFHLMDWLLYESTHILPAIKEAMEKGITNGPE